MVQFSPALPDTAHIGDEGHVGDHNALTAALELLNAQKLGSTVATKNSNYTLSSSDEVVVATSGTWTATLPAGVTSKAYTIKNSGTGTITVVGTGGETIDGDATVDLTADECLTVVFSGSEWLVVNTGSSAVGRLPLGGDAGQALVKASGDNYDTEWGEPTITNNVVGDGTITQVVALTSAEYAALDPKVSTTLYVIVG